MPPASLPALTLLSGANHKYFRCLWQFMKSVLRSPEAQACRLRIYDLGLWPEQKRQLQRAFDVFVMPSLARVFEKKTWLGDKLKHVIEPRVSYRDVRGVHRDYCTSSSTRSARRERRRAERSPYIGRLSIRPGNAGAEPRSDVQPQALEEPHDGGVGHRIGPALTQAARANHYTILTTPGSPSAHVQTMSRSKNRRITSIFVRR